MGRIRGRKADAYFTVEAAMVMPIVLSVVLMMIFLFVYQYDRCLMEQDMGLIAMRAGAALGNSTEDLSAEMRLRAAELDQNKYVLWEIISLDISMERGQIKVEGTGQLTFPVPEWNLFRSENVWAASTTYRNTGLSPVNFIRQYRKVTGGK